MKFHLQAITFKVIEEFLYINFIAILVLIAFLALGFFKRKTYFNLKNICPKCGAVKDISRIKKDKVFRTIGFTDSYKKYLCKKCKNKFYVFNKKSGSTVKPT